jgi:two-component system response regulator HydG
MAKRILVIDDDTYICDLLGKYLKTEGYKTDATLTGKKGLQLFHKHPYDLVLLDYRLPDTDGYTMLQSLRKLNSSIPVIIITAYGDIRSAVNLIKNGAANYITKPMDQEDLLNMIREALAGNRTHGRGKNFKKEFIHGQSKEFKEIMELAKLVAPTNMTVLIEGETGSGKEYISRSIHHNSTRKAKPFVAVDCGAIPHELANSELFGHVKGSFTGAIKDKTGSFETAHGGTLFLDEIGNLPYEVQVKLLRVLQERTINRVGENRDIRIDVRIIAASNEPLTKLVNENKFRDDLFHRINEFKIIVPPLRERPDDIMIFAEYFRETSNEELNKHVSGFSERVKQTFRDYPWHGNLRELRNVVKRSVLLCWDDIIENHHLPYELKKELQAQPSGAKMQGDINLKEASVKFERDIIIDTLRKANYNKSKAARILKIDRKTLYNKLNKLNIDPDKLK